jgi:hypothetical protein
LIFCDTINTVETKGNFIMTKQIDELMALATNLPVASLGSQQSYIEAVEELRTALEAALGQPQPVAASNGDQPGLVSTSSLKPSGEPMPKKGSWKDDWLDFSRPKYNHGVNDE